MSTRHGTATVDLVSDLEIRITRVFDAPASLVFEVWTEPEHVQRWWGWEHDPLVVCEIDLRVGGSWRYVSRRPDGSELGWGGTYREIEPPHRLVTTEVFEGSPDTGAISTLRLVERERTTVLTIDVLHTSRANRDGHVASGMERGLQHGLDRVEDLLRSLTATPGS